MECVRPEEEEEDHRIRPAKLNKTDHSPVCTADNSCATDCIINISPVYMTAHSSVLTENCVTLTLSSPRTSPCHDIDNAQHTKPPHNV